MVRRFFDPIPAVVAILLVPTCASKAIGTCATAGALALDLPVSGTTTNASNDFQLTGKPCFSGVGQNPTAAGGRDEISAFTSGRGQSRRLRNDGLPGGGSTGDGRLVPSGRQPRGAEGPSEGVY